MKPIIELAAEYFGVAIGDLKCGKRIEPLTSYRMIATSIDMAINGSFEAMKAFGYSVQSSPTNARIALMDRIKVEPYIARDYENLMAIVSGLPVKDRLPWPSAKARDAKGSYPRAHPCECGKWFEAQSFKDEKNGCPKCREKQSALDRERNGKPQNSRPWHYIEEYRVCLP
jgi:hypothetical protein